MTFKSGSWLKSYYSWKQIIMMQYFEEVWVCHSLFAQVEVNFQRISLFLDFSRFSFNISFSPISFIYYVGNIYLSKIGARGPTVQWAPSAWWGGRERKEMTLGAAHLWAVVLLLPLFLRAPCLPSRPCLSYTSGTSLPLWHCTQFQAIFFGQKSPRWCPAECFRPGCSSSGVSV